MKNILIINNNLNNKNGIYTPILIENIKTNHNVFECRNIKEMNNVINDKIKIDLIITCGSSINLMNDVNIYKDISKTTLALLSFRKVPIVGICFGMQLLCLLYGCSLYERKRKKKDFEELYKVKDSKILKNMSNVFEGFCTNDIFCDFSNNSDLDVLVKDKDNNIMAFKHKNEEVYGIQFHGEIKKKDASVNQIIQNILEL